MKIFLLLLLFTGLVLTSCNVIQFGSMIKHLTGKSPLAYNGYGCYCGLGGSKQPVDKTDWCCHAHDCCYRKLSAARCNAKLATYNYSISGRKITCKSGNWCQKQSCECDKRAAECFQRVVSTYRTSYKHYPNSRCKGKAPRC
ncbi:group IIE secretory phospholipase A2-like isoform X2 [Melanerpes formicivorus]|uniref:group IIE secretory phospholipase A2-like isoform X2 n=1 Tax=Melanerpes formicivorus TaxID=211600 RepID=UPI0035901889